jgi:hypothetical protein
MATYRTISASETDADSPVTATLVSALAENPTAIAEGADGALRNYGLSMVPDSKVIDDGKVLSVTAANTYLLATIFGVFGFDLISITTSTTSGSDVVAFRYTSLGYIVGTLRFNAGQLGTGDFTSTLSLFKNNSLVTSFSGVGSRSVDLSFAAGDVVEWRHRRTSGSGTSIIGGFGLRASDNYTRIGALIRMSDL